MELLLRTDRGGTMHITLRRMNEWFEFHLSKQKTKIK